MKARVLETGKIFDVYGVLSKTCDGYGIGEVELMVDDKDSFNYDMTPAYWERLRHEYAGMAMQGIVSSYEAMREISKERDIPQYVANMAFGLAHALVEKLKESK